MTQFDNQASVHHKTVTQISRDGSEKPTRKFYGRAEHQKNSVYIKVDPRVWKAALNACAGDPHRIEVISEHHVEIHNDPNWRKH